MSSNCEGVGVEASIVLATLSMLDMPEKVFLITSTGAPCFPMSTITSPNSTTLEASFCNTCATLSTLDGGTVTVGLAVTGALTFCPEVAAAAAGFSILGITLHFPNPPDLFSSLSLFLASSAVQPMMVGSFGTLGCLSRAKASSYRCSVSLLPVQYPSDLHLDCSRGQGHARIDQGHKCNSKRVVPNRPPSGSSSTTRGLINACLISLALALLVLPVAPFDSDPRVDVLAVSFSRKSGGI
nr:hypothetical protein Iba_chr10eCG13070 [Ipomoea batatas]